MQENATAVGALLRTPLYSASPDPLAGFRGSLSGVEGRKQGEGKGEAQEGRGRMLTLMRSGCQTA